MKRKPYLQWEKNKVEFGVPMQLDEIKSLDGIIVSNFLTILNRTTIHVIYLVKSRRTPTYRLTETLSTLFSSYRVKSININEGMEKR